MRYRSFLVSFFIFQSIILLSKSFRLSLRNMGPKGKKRALEISSEVNDASAASDAPINKKTTSSAHAVEKYVTIEHCKSWYDADRCL